jgi:hypothetical protein
VPECAKPNDQSFLPSVRNRLRQKIPIFQEFVTMITGHGKLRSYLHRFGLMDDPMCRVKKKKKKKRRTNYGSANIAMQQIK